MCCFFSFCSPIPVPELKYINGGEWCTKVPQYQNDLCMKLSHFPSEIFMQNKHEIKAPTNKTYVALTEQNKDDKSGGYFNYAWQRT